VSSPSRLVAVVKGVAADASETVAASAVQSMWLALFSCERIRFILDRDLGPTCWYFRRAAMTFRDELHLVLLVAGNGRCHIIRDLLPMDLSGKPKSNVRCWIVLDMS
jgi:hypothetical protein